jgi:hypothetical protein
MVFASTCLSHMKRDSKQHKKQGVLAFLRDEPLSTGWIFMFCTILDKNTTVMTIPWTFLFSLLSIVYFCLN